MILAENRYGKQRVRVLKVFRSTGRHAVKELTVSCLLRGNFEAPHLGPDNSPVVPTDTVKNTIHVLARDFLTENSETFALRLADHFLVKYGHITGVEVDLAERVWQRMEIGGQPHAHSFVERGQGTPVVSLQQTRDNLTLASGITGLLVMKTTESGFAGYPQCDFTTLPETADRIMATSIDAQWTYATPGEAGPEPNAVVLEAIQRVFATTWSPSVQRTLFQMGEAALEAVPDLTQVALQLPNKHYLPLDLSRFGRENEGEVFLPTDEPHGQIEAVVRRDP
jgi:urate oxidase